MRDQVIVTEVFHYSGKRIGLPKTKKKQFDLGRNDERNI